MRLCRTSMRLNATCLDLSRLLLRYIYWLLSVRNIRHIWWLLPLRNIGHIDWLLSLRNIWLKSSAGIELCRWWVPGQPSSDGFSARLQRTHEHLDLLAFDS